MVDFVSARIDGETVGPRQAAAEDKCPGKPTNHGKEHPLNKGRTVGSVLWACDLSYCMAVKLRIR